MTQTTATLREVIASIEYKRQLDEGRRSRGYNCLYRQVMKGSSWLKTEHWFQYKHGNHDIGKPVRLLGREAKKRNAKLEDRFFKDKSPDARLGHWFWLKEREDEPTDL